MTDGALVRHARTGDAAALAELTHRWAGKILALCHVQIGRPDMAADLAQESLLRALRGLHSLQEPEKFGPWVRGIAKRVCLDWLKTKPRAAVPFSTLGRDGKRLDDLRAAAMTESPMERQEQEQELHEAVAALPEELREVLLLYYHQDVTYQELAELLNVSSATINARLTRARALLRDRLCAGQESVR